MQGTNTVIGQRTAIIQELLVESLTAARNSGLLSFVDCPQFTIEVPRDPSHGDFATNAAMLMSKACRKSPRDVAKIIVEKLPDHPLIQGVEIAGPGFINFRLTEQWLTDCLQEILAQGDQYGRSNFGGGHKVQVEFVSANPTGEPHMGNARGAAIGDTLAAVLQLAGFEVEREFYINDAGNQIEKLALSVEARYLQAIGEDVPFPEDGYHGQDITRTIQELVDAEGDKYRNLAPEQRRTLLTEYTLNKKITSIRETLAQFGVQYDVWFSERDLHESGAVTAVVKKLQDSGCLYEKDQAIWFDCQRFLPEKDKKAAEDQEKKDEVLVRSNGVPTYFAADIAYHNDKFTRGFEQVIDIWGADHHGHVARMKAAMTALGYDPDRLEVVLMQLVRLYQNGEVVRMSKRTGTYVTLAELIEDVGKDAARFFFVMRSADSTIDFDLDLAKKQSSDNPVYYVQYAHARICSMIAAAAKEGYHPGNLSACNLHLLQHDSERALIRRMADFADEIILAAQHREPHRLAVYVQEVAGLFHNFYSHCRVLGEAQDLASARLWLAKGVAGIIKTALTAMGVSAPEKM